MSVFGVSSYFLWTQKGMTTLPLVRGSGFTIKADLVHSFYTRHVITAAHVACPVKYPAIYGNTNGLRAIGERHISTKVLLPNLEPQQAATRNGKTRLPMTKTVDLEFAQKRFNNVDACSLRIKNESSVLKELGDSLQPFEVDITALQEGEELIFLGMKSTEDVANPSDNDLMLEPRRFEGRVLASLQTRDFGTVLLAQTDVLPHGSLCGGPVVRKSNGRCVGVIVAPVRSNAPPRRLPREREDSEASADEKERIHARMSADATRATNLKDVMDSLIAEPWLDVSSTAEVSSVPNLNVAFVPLMEFHSALRRHEL